MEKIKVGIVGIGNCAKSLVEGISGRQEFVIFSSKQKKSHRVSSLLMRLMQLVEQEVKIQIWALMMKERILLINY